jgi:hypothetical protein
MTTSPIWLSAVLMDLLISSTQYVEITINNNLMWKVVAAFQTTLQFHQQIPLIVADCCCIGSELNFQLSHFDELACMLVMNSLPNSISAWISTSQTRPQPLCMNNERHYYSWLWLRCRMWIWGPKRPFLFWTPQIEAPFPGLRAARREFASANAQRFPALRERWWSCTAQAYRGQALREGALR